MPGPDFERLRVVASRKLEPKAVSPRAISHLVAASVRAVGALKYLVALDDVLDAPSWSRADPRDMVDAAHTRWATASAISALDACAAVLGRVHSPSSAVKFETDLRGLDPASTKKKAGGLSAADRFSKLRAPWQSWVRDVHSDPRYARVLRARHALAHSSVPEEVTSGVAGHALRWRFAIGADLDTVNISIPPAAWIGSRQLVLECAELATDRVRGFLEAAAEWE